MTGLGSPLPARIRAGDPNVGEALADPNIRGLTGATVLAIRRKDLTVLIPAGHDRLEAGDILAGLHDAVYAAKMLLATKEADPDHSEGV